MNLGNVHFVGLDCIIILKCKVQKHKKAPKIYRVFQKELYNFESV
jgi:hypothetical protein